MKSLSSKEEISENSGESSDYDDFDETEYSYSEDQISDDSGDDFEDTSEKYFYENTSKQKEHTKDVDDIDDDNIDSETNNSNEIDTTYVYYYNNYEETPEENWRESIPILLNVKILNFLSSQLYSWKQAGKEMQANNEIL